jgi:hypothetical protein
MSQRVPPKWKDRGADTGFNAEIGHGSVDADNN